MAAGDPGDVGGPQLQYSRPDEALFRDRLTEALDLARRIEELLADTRSIAGPISASASGFGDRLEASTHSTRMARAMAASLVDELKVLARHPRSSSVA